MVALKNIPETSRCRKFVHFVTKLYNALLDIPTLNCNCKWVNSGHRLDNSSRPLSVKRQLSLNITFSTSGHATFLVWLLRRRNILLKARSPFIFSPRNEKKNQFRDFKNQSI